MAHFYGPSLELLKEFLKESYCYCLKRKMLFFWPFLYLLYQDLQNLEKLGRIVPSMSKWRDDPIIHILPYPKLNNEKVKIIKCSVLNAVML